MHKVGYIRISDKDKQDPASQMKLMQDCGIATEHIFVDALSGSSAPMKRPSYKKMYECLLKGGVDILVVSEFSRIGRTVHESLSEVLSIQKMGIKIESLSSVENMINNLPIGLQPTIISAMMYSAQLERDHIRERTKWGMENAKENGTESGKPIGRPKVDINIQNVYSFAKEKNLKVAQALRVLGIKPRTFYEKKKREGC